MGYLTSVSNLANYLKRITTTNHHVCVTAPCYTGQPNGLTYLFEYGYYLNGEMAGIKNPSGSRYAHCYDDLGRAAWVKKIAAATAFPTTCDSADPAVVTGEEELRAQVEEFHFAWSHRIPKTGWPRIPRAVVLQLASATHRTPLRQ